MVQLDDTLHVCDVTDGNGAWDLTILRSLLPDNIVTQIIGMIPSIADARPDHLAWKWMAAGRFSTTKTFRRIYPSVNEGNSNT